MHTKDEIELIKQFIEDRPNAMIYLGSDSQRMKKKKVKYATVVVIHYIDDNGIGKGAKIFADVTYRETIDNNLSKPFNRMMTEVAMITELYEQLEDVLIDREFEIHLDVSPYKSAGSNVAHDAAKWTIFGNIGVEPITKPNAFAASVAADRYSK